MGYNAIAISIMSESKSLKVALSLLLVTIVVLMASSGAEARYLPTRSDPMAPIGPPRGEDPRFDRLYDLIKDLLRNSGGEGFEEKIPAERALRHGHILNNRPAPATALIPACLLLLFFSSDSSSSCSQALSESFILLLYPWLFIRGQRSACINC